MLDYKKDSCRRTSINVIDIYTRVLNQNGIYMKPLTELSFNTLYGRYKQLGGSRKFLYRTEE